MATLTKSTGTVALSGAVEKVNLPAAYGWVWVKNMSEGNIFAGLSANISEGADGVMVIPAGEAGRIQMDGFCEFYLLGSGNVLVVAQNYADSPFKAGVKGGGSDVDGKSSYALTNAVDYPLLGLNLYGKSVQDGTPTPENPVEIVSVGDSGSVGVTACGKNLLNPTLQTTTSNGVTCTNNGDGTYTLNGTCTGAVAFNLQELDISSGIKKLVGCPNNGGKTTFKLDIIKISTSDTYTADYGSGGMKNIKRTLNNCTLRIVVYSGVTLNNLVFKPMLTTNLTATYDDFEPYHGTTANITSGFPLCGIPVESGGNYTDSTGQQWVCDELIYNADGTEKIIKHTAKIGSYNGETITTPYISSTGSLTTGAAVVYALDTPQEIELTAAEMSALRQLQTFNGITNISNDGGADMDVSYCTNKVLSEYVMPITTGLQKQIDELKSAVLSLGGNV